MDEQEAKALSVKMFLDATPASNDAPMDEWRDGFEALAAKLGMPDSLDIVPVDVGGVPCLKVTAPGARKDVILVHYHSGGYVMGSANAYRQFGGRLSAAVGVPVLLPDYRLAPEHVFPAAADDGLAVYEALLKTYDASKIVLSGDSAGGGLCIATLINIRDKGLPLPACALAIGPLLDLAGEGASAVEGADPLIDRSMIVDMGKVYIGDLDPHETPLASPLWGKHHDFPPVYLTASVSEALRDDSVRLARSIEAAGGKVELSLVEDEIHIWPFFPFLKSAETSLSEIATFVGRYLPVA